MSISQSCPLSLHLYCDHLTLGQVRSCLSYLPQLLVSASIQALKWSILYLVAKVPLKV